MTSEAQLRAIKKWQDKMDEVRFRVPKGKKEEYTQHAQKQGETLTAFMTRAVEETIKRDNTK